jgi:hypothetical protein
MVPTNKMIRQSEDIAHSGKSTLTGTVPIENTITRR